VTDGRGLPLGGLLTAGPRHESSCVEALLACAGLPPPGHRTRCRPRRVVGDKAYSAPRIRRWLQGRAIVPVIPRRQDELAQLPVPPPFDRLTYRRRNVIERCVGRLKEARAVATRFDKLAVNYLAMVKLAMVKLHFRALLASPDRA
jgi:transposase